MTVKITRRVAPIAGMLAALIAGATEAQDVARMTVRQVYDACPKALRDNAPQLMTTRAQLAYRNSTLAQAGVSQSQERSIGVAMRAGDCGGAEANSALSADEPAKPDHPRERDTPDGSPPP